MPNPTATRLFDRLLGFLLRPRIRRIRRWSFLVTLPAGFVVGRALGFELGDGLLLGALAALLDLTVVVAAAVAGGRLLGPERRDALLDLLMHPVARRAMAGEARVVATIPLALWRRRRPPRGERFAYHRGSQDLAFAIALLPALLAEGVAVHLLLPDDWLWARIAAAAVHLYGIVMLLSYAAGTRTTPHRLRDGVLDLRSGPLYRARVAAADVVSVAVERRRGGGRTGLLLRDGRARLATDGRTDVVLRFAAPVAVERPLGDPVAVTELEVAVDDPERFVAALRAAAATPRAPVAERGTRELLGWLTPGELAAALS